MEHIHDWCISRQLWWGHQIPVYYCGLEGLSPLQKELNPDLVKKYQNKLGCGKFMVSGSKPKKCLYCQGKSLIQDPDTLDTWFSSGQWPYTTLGFPKSKDFQYFYPTSVMETGYEILNIWVAKMIMFGLYRTGKIPFKTVYLHGLVRDALGQKMSKSKGNVIDPLTITQKYGADALRMALVVGATPGKDLSVEEAKIKGYRNFANKLWNIARYIELNKKPVKNHLENLTKADKDFLKQLQTLVSQVTDYLENFKYSLAGETLYAFIWHDLADQYLELNKDRLKSSDEAVISVLINTLKTCLKLLHPFMPFVTEAIWQEFKDQKEPSLISAVWPKATRF